jgi:haloacid dehalogenase superfamily, subfamily IA, variant 3 with third motif having DD or ED
MEIKAVILDCDGTMFDSERIWWDVWFAVGKEHGVVVPEEFLISITGSAPNKERNIQEEYPEIVGISPLVRERGQKQFERIFAEKINIQKPGLDELITYLLQKNIKIAVASNSATSHVFGLLNTTSFVNQLDVVTCREDVSKGKPDPEGLLKTAERLQVDPHHCLVIEDSKLGTQAAKNAEMHRIYIKDLVPKDDELNSYIEFELNNLTEVIPFIEAL